MANVVVWVVTISGVISVLGLSLYQGYTWHKRTGGGFLSLVGALACGLVVGTSAVLGAEALASYDYFVATWASEGITARHLVIGFVVGSGSAAAGWVARRGQEKRQRSG